ncbi:DUF2179 domain-containing protein [Candidatus Latescibacterota bacterium]
MNSPYFLYLVLPFLIFLARIMDVSIGTMRVIFVSRGYKKLAVFCGFFEVLIWIIAITQIMKNMGNVFTYLGYAAGFATGNYVGMVIEEKIALGRVMIRIITPNDVSRLQEYLKNNNYGLTNVQGAGIYGTVNILFTVVPRQEVKDIVVRIKEFNPHAFYTIEDIRFVADEHVIYDLSNRRNKLRPFSRPLRKGK